MAADYDSRANAADELAGRKPTEVETAPAEPKEDGSAQEGSAQEGPAQEGPAQEGPAQEGPVKETTEPTLEETVRLRIGRRTVKEAKASTLVERRPVGRQRGV